MRDFLNLKFEGNPTSKGLAAMPPKSPLISLKSSQYLLKYTLEDSPSLMAMVCKKSMGFGTLLHVINLAPNALVNSSNDLMDPSSNPSNHLMAVGPRLRGKTLDMRALFLEWMAILWVKWLKCSTGFVLSL